MKFLVRLFIDWPGRLAAYFSWLAPLLARVTVGWVFLWSGWGKLNDLPTVIENFASWGIPFPHVLAPFVSTIDSGWAIAFAGIVYAAGGGSADGRHDRCDLRGEAARN